MWWGVKLRMVFEMPACFERALGGVQPRTDQAIVLWLPTLTNKVTEHVGQQGAWLLVQKAFRSWHQQPQGRKKVVPVSCAAARTKRRVPPNLANGIGRVPIARTAQRWECN
jgi:hypothetical protein